MISLRTFLQSILKDTNAIEEVCHGRHICTHSSFGLDDDDPDMEPVAYFVLCGCGDDDNVTFIDLAQSYEIRDNKLYVKDTNDNELELTFYRHQLIPMGEMNYLIGDVEKTFLNDNLALQYASDMSDGGSIEEVFRWNDEQQMWVEVV
jgi:hypothetical protein